MAIGLMWAGGAIGTIAPFLPWMTTADGVTHAGVDGVVGVVALTLAVATMVLGVVIALRPDHPQARMAAFGVLFTSLGIGACGLLGAYLAWQTAGATYGLGIAVTILGGFVANMGARVLVEHR
jgi:hypothetical protein